MAQRFGRYNLVDFLASGGMADVYRAEMPGEAGFSKELAIKVIRGDYGDRPEFVEMFKQEARLASKLTHANIVQVFDFGQVEGHYFLAMEFVHGRTLGQVADRCKALGIGLDLTRVCSVCSQVASALSYAHRQKERGKPLGLVHRDVSPQNVLISIEGEVKLTDFGIARATMMADKLTRPGFVKGKAAYMAPEQARGLAVDARADVFALGVVLWELCCGFNFFERETETASLLAVLGPEPAIAPPSHWNAQIPAELDAAIMGALEREVVKRTGSAQELATQLQTVLLKLARSPDDFDMRDLMHRLWPEGATAAGTGRPLTEQMRKPLGTPSSPGELPGSADDFSPPREAAGQASFPKTQVLSPDDPRQADWQGEPPADGYDQATPEYDQPAGEYAPSVAQYEQSVGAEVAAMPDHGRLVQPLDRDSLQPRPNDEPATHAGSGMFQLGFSGEMPSPAAQSQSGAVRPASRPQTRPPVRSPSTTPRPRPVTPRSSPARPVAPGAPRGRAVTPAPRRPSSERLPTQGRVQPESEDVPFDEPASSATGRRGLRLTALVGGAGVLVAVLVVVSVRFLSPYDGGPGPGRSTSPSAPAPAPVPPPTAAPPTPAPPAPTAAPGTGGPADPNLPPPPLLQARDPDEVKTSAAQPDPKSRPKPAGDAHHAPRPPKPSHHDDGASGSSHSSKPAQVAGEAKLQVLSGGAWAIVYVDGKRAGFTPLTLTLPSGKHQLRAEREGFKTEEHAVTLQPSGEAFWTPQLRRQ